MFHQLIKCTGKFVRCYLRMHNIRVQVAEARRRVKGVGIRKLTIPGLSQRFTNPLSSCAIQRAPKRPEVDHPSMSHRTCDPRDHSRIEVIVLSAHTVLQ